jgi:BatD DUF11 like domain
MKRFSFVSFLFVFISALSAQTFRLDVSTKKAAVNERIAVQYSFDAGNLPQNVIPNVNNMMVVGGPSVMHGSTTINGVTNTTSELTYEVIFTKPGTYTIPASTIKNKQGTFKSNPVQITVVKGNNSKSIIPQGYEGKELLIVMVGNKKTAYLGEPIAIDMVVYSIYNNLSIADINYPTFDGGWTQDATDAFNGQLEPASYKGKPYLKTTIRRVWMIPSILGQVEFKPVNAVFQAGLDDPLAGHLEFTKKAVSDPVIFDVIDLPTNKRPESFINAIGNYSWTVKLDKAKAKANEPLKMNIKIDGNGNLPTLESPLLNLPEQFEVFEPKIKNTSKVEIKGINGSKEFEFMIMPRKEGNYTLGPFEFSYFDADTKKYTTLTSDSFEVNIQGIIADTTAKTAEVNNGKFNGGEVYKKKDPFFGNPFYYVLLIIPFLAGLAMIFFRKKFFFTKKDDSEKKLKQAEDKANKALDEARLALSNNNPGHVTSLLSALFYQYLCDKFKVHKNEISRVNIEKWMPELSLKISAIKILDQLDQFRFAPAAQSDVDSLYMNIKNFIDELGKK